MMIVNDDDCDFSTSQLPSSILFPLFPPCSPPLCRTLCRIKSLSKLEPNFLKKSQRCTKYSISSFAPCFMLERSEFQMLNIFARHMLLHSRGKDLKMRLSLLFWVEFSLLLRDRAGFVTRLIWNWELRNMGENVGEIWEKMLEKYGRMENLRRNLKCRNKMSNKSVK